MEVRCPNPLTQEHCDALTRAIHKNAETAALIAKCKECGIPMDEDEARNNQLGDTARALKRQFFPNNG